MPIHDWTRVYAGLFHHFHQSWSIRIADALNAGLLPNGLTALVEQRSGPKESDVLAVDFLDGTGRRGDSDGGTMIATPPSTQIVRKSAKEHYADRANRIVVKHNLGRTIAVIEIVSPGNKDSKPAFKEFLEKSLGFIDAGIHLLIVDLFPPTKRDPHGIHRAIWDEFENEDVFFEFPAGKDRILASYDAGRDKGAYVEPVALGESMPDMPLFLIEGHHIRVPLEATYQATWLALPKPMQLYVLTGKPPGDAVGNR
jgi:Protein of unknown function (DUF4058)